MSGQPPRQSLPRQVKGKQDVKASTNIHTRSTRKSTFLCEPLQTDAEEGVVAKLKIRKLNLSEEKVQKTADSKLVTKSKGSRKLDVEKSVESRAITESPLASRRSSLSVQHPQRKSKKYSDESPLTPTRTDSAESSNAKYRSMLRNTPKKSYKENFIDFSYSPPKKNSKLKPLKHTRKLPSSSSDKHKKHPEVSPLIPDVNSNEYPSTSRRAMRNTPKKKNEEFSTSLKGDSSSASSPIQNVAKTRQKVVNQHSKVNSKKKYFEPSPPVSSPEVNDSSETRGSTRSSRKPGLRAKIRLNYTEDFVYTDKLKANSTNYIPSTSDSESEESDCDTQTQSGSSDDESSIKEEIQTTIAFRSEKRSLDPSEKVKRIKRSRFGDGIFTLEDFDTCAHPELYFVAENRIKYATSKKSEPVMNDVRKGKKVKKPRKGERGTGGRKATLPQKPIYKYSVTKEATRAAATRNIIVDTNKHHKECNTIMDNLVSDFPRWMLLMKEGFNVMLYGYGSKLPVFQSFKSTVEDNFLTVSINGLYPKLNARKFLIDFCKALDLEESFTFSGTNIDMIAEDVYNSLRRLSMDCPDVFLLVKNLDTLAVRHPSLLTALSAIARVDFVHILASTDHINPFLGVSQTQTINFNFAWVDCATFHPYEEELTWKPEVFGNDKETNSGKTAFEHVMKSLTANARKAFSILATLQVAKINSLGKSKSKEFSGIEFRELARKCRESFVAHSETALNNLLIEFIDHQLIRHSGKGKTSNNLLVIDLDIDTLNEIINST